MYATVYFPSNWAFTRAVRWYDQHRGYWLLPHYWRWLDYRQPRSVDINVYG